ncbi:MAG: energy-coupling factor ABC transporter permease [Lysobacteraceae bacterium]
MIDLPDIDMSPASAAIFVLAVAVLVWASRGLPWYKLRDDPEAQRVLLLTTAALTAMRWFNTDALAGVHLHFIGATVACLMFGPRFALWSMAVVSLAAWVMGSVWQGWAPDFLVCGPLAILVTEAVGRYIERKLPPNPLIYVWVRGFLGGALAIAASNLAKAGLAWWLDDAAVAAYLVTTLPMMFGEGFFCGGAMALIVVYRPKWCASFDDARYLRPR